MAAVITGTPVFITWAAGASPSAQNVTVPADATAGYMKWAYDGIDANGHGLSSATLAGNSPAPGYNHEVATGAGYFPATGVVAWANPPTGTQSLQVAWDSAPVEGPTCVVFFTKGGDTTNLWRDVKSARATSTTAVSVTVTTQSGDLVLKGDQRFDAAENPPSLTSGWTNGVTGGNVDEGFRLSYITATGTTQVCACEDEDYSSIVAISIPAESGPSITAGLAELALTGYAPSVSATGGGDAITAGLGELSLTGLAPTLAATDHHFIAPSLGELTFTGYAPSFAASGNFSVEAGLAQLSFTGLAPSLARTENVFVTAGLGQLTATGYEPSQTLTLPSPPPGALVLTGYSPGVQVSAPGEITAGLGQLTLTGLAPTVSATDSYSVSAGLAQLTLTGLAPALAVTEHQFAAPDVGLAVLTGFAPTLAATENQFATPAVGELTLDGYAPSLTQAGSFSASPDVGILELLGLAPSVSSSEAVVSGGGKGDNDADGWAFSRYRSFNKQTKEAKPKKQKPPEPAFAKVLGPNLLAQFDRPANPVIPAAVAETIKKQIKPQPKAEPKPQRDDEDDAIALLLMALA